MAYNNNILDTITLRNIWKYNSPLCNGSQREIEIT